MKQLSGSDNLFLEMEKGNQMAHIASLGIYDPSTSPGQHVRFKAVLEHFTERFNSATIFRRRLVRTPFNIDRPYWVEDPSFDIEFHARHIALPKPGDWRQLCIQVARLHSRPIDFNRPPWEAYVIEGLDNIPGLPRGCFAVYMKFHHSLVDGGAGAEVLKLMHETSPEPRQSSGGRRVTIADREPTALELIARTVGTRFSRMLGATRLSVELGAMGLRMGQERLSQEKGSQPDKALMAHKAPVTRFGDKVSPHRVIDATPLDLAQMKLIQGTYPGVTVNDIFMAVSAGGVRRYLEAKGELPAETLNAMVPMSTRSGPSGTDDGNQIGTVAMPLFTNIADDGERLVMIKRGTDQAKRTAEETGKDLQQKLFEIIPTAATDFIVRQFVLPTANLTVSNVRGPSVPLYLAGAKLVTFMPINMVVDGMGLSVTGFSYNGALWVCVVSCRKMLPDPDLFVQCLKDSMAQLLAGATAEPEAAPPIKKKKPS